MGRSLKCNSSGDRLFFRCKNNFELSNNANNCSKVYINGDENEVLSFEGLIKQNKISQVASQNLDCCDAGVDIDEFTDSEYQYLKPLLYVELVAIFDQHKIVFLKRKASTKYKGERREILGHPG